MKALGTMENCRSKAQQEEMRRTIMSGKCCFCHVDPKVNATLAETKHWKVIENAFPYKHTKRHAMIIPKEHWVSLLEISSGAWKDLHRVFKWTERNIAKPGGGMFVRLGKHSHSSGTIFHLHFQVVVPTLRGPLIALFAKARNGKQAEKLAKAITKSRK